LLVAGCLLLVAGCSLLVARSPSESKVGQMQLLLHLVTDLEVVARNCSFAVGKLLCRRRRFYTIFYLIKLQRENCSRSAGEKLSIFLCVDCNGSGNVSCSIRYFADCFACDKLMNVTQFSGL